MQTFELKFESKLKENDKEGWIKDSDTILAYSREDAVNRFNEETKNHPHLLFREVSCIGLYNESRGMDPEEKYWKGVTTYNERNSFD